MFDCKQFRSCEELFSRYEIYLSEQQYRILSEFANMLLSARQNLTAVSDPSQVWIRHFLDSAYLLRYFPPNSSIIDIGTGGGIPGIPLAILRPDLNLTLLDSELSKIEFCRSAVITLGLNCTAVNGRAEELAHQTEYREQFDFAVSRAVALGSMLSELALPYVKPGGALIAMKGRGFDADTERFSQAALALNASEPVVTSYLLENEQKYLIITGKEQTTPSIYPRRFAKMKREPL